MLKRKIISKDAIIQIQITTTTTSSSSNNTLREEKVTKYNFIDWLPEEIWVIIMKSNSIVDMLGMASCCQLWSNYWKGSISQTKKRYEDIINKLVFMCNNNKSLLEGIIYLCSAAEAGASKYISDIIKKNCIPKMINSPIDDDTNFLYRLCEDELLKNIHFFWMCLGLDDFNKMISLSHLPKKWELGVLYTLVKLGDVKYIKKWMLRKGMNQKLKKWKNIQSFVPGSLDALDWLRNYKNKKLSINNNLMIRNSIILNKPELYAKADEFKISTSNTFLNLACKHLSNWILPYIKKAPINDFSVFKLFIIIANRQHGFKSKEKRFIINLIKHIQKLQRKQDIHVLDMTNLVRVDFRKFHSSCLSSFVDHRGYKPWHRTLLLDFIHKNLMKNDKKYMINNTIKIYKSPYLICEEIKTWLWLFDNTKPPNTGSTWHFPIYKFGYSDLLKISNHIIRNPPKNNKNEIIPLITANVFIRILDAYPYEKFAMLMYHIMTLMMTTTTKSTSTRTMIIIKPDFECKNLIPYLYLHYARKLYMTRYNVKKDHILKHGDGLFDLWKPGEIMWKKFMQIIFTYVKNHCHGHICTGECKEYEIIFSY